MIFTDLFESRDICRVCGQTPCNCTHVAESAGNVGDTVRSLYQQFYDQGDDALEYLNTHAENFARYWDRFEGDLDSMIEELPPKILARLAQELQTVAAQEGLAEGSEKHECSECDGSGYVQWHGSDTECPKCDGTGYVEQGVAEEAENKDMTGQPCEKCKRGKYQETSIHDDMDGVLHCTKCGTKVDRWRAYKEPGVAEGSNKNVVKSVKVGNFRHDLVDTGFGWQVRIYNGDELYDTGLSKNSEQKGLAALDDAVAYTKKQLNIKEQGMAEEKVRLDPKCWKGKKIGNPKTKMKGGVRVNNCVPAESVAEGVEQSTDEILQKLTAAYRSCVKHRDSYTNFGNIQTVYELLRDPLMQGNIQGFEKAHAYVSGKYPDAFDLLMDEVPGQGVEENYDNGEYSDEAGMAHGNLITIARAAEGLLHTIDRHEDLPEWVQEKIAKVEGMLVTAWNYLQSQEAQGIDPRVTEMYANLAENWQRVSHRLELNQEFDLIESIVQSIARRNGVDAETVWADLESLTEDELYVFAVTSEPIMEDWQKANKRDKTDGMSRKAVNAYRREHPGSKLQTAVTTKPSKLKKGSKASKRRKSYCSRSRGQMKMHNISCAKTPDKAICKARRRWNCEGVDRSDQIVVAEGVTSPEIKQAYKDIMNTAPNTPERKNAVSKYIKLRADALDKKRKEQGVAEGIDRLDPFTRTVINYMEDNTWLTAERAYFRALGLQKKKHMPRQEYEQEIQRYIDLYDQFKGVTEGDMYGDQEVSWEKGGRRAPTGAFRAPALSAANAAAEYQRSAGGYRGRVDVKVGSREEYMSALKALQNAARQAGLQIEVGRVGDKMSVFSDSTGSDELGQFVDNTLQQGVAEADKLQGTPVVSLSDFGDKDNTKDKYGRTVPKKLKKDDPRVRFHKDYNQHEKKLISKMSNAEKADKGWRNPNIDEHGVAEGSLNEISADLISRARDAAGRKWASADDRKDKKASKKYNAQDSRLTDRLNAKKSKEQGVAEVSDATLTSYLTKVDADSQKHDQDPTKRSAEKRNKSVSGFARAFNKLDARKEKTEEGQMQENDLAQQMLALAKKISPNARLAGTPEQERERTQQMLAQRARDRNNQPAQEVSAEQRAQLQAKLKELEAKFDPDYEYSDDHSFWSKQNAIAQQINSIRKQLSITEISKQKLGDYLHAAHRDVVDRATSSSFQSGQVGDKFNRSEVSPKERQREIGMQRAVKRLTREGSSVAEAWASRYPNLDSDIEECQASGNDKRLGRLMAIKNIIDSELGEQSGLGFGEQQEKEADYGDEYQSMVQRMGQKAREQEKIRPVDIADLARKMRAIDQSKDNK